MVRLYCFLRLNLKTITLSPRPCSEMVPLTRASANAAPAVTSFASFTTASTRPNSTSEPTSPGSVSTRTSSPGATRYCFPPVSITAYITILRQSLECGSSGRTIQEEPPGAAKLYDTAGCVRHANGGCELRSALHPQPQTPPWDSCHIR